MEGQQHWVQVAYLLGSAEYRARLSLCRDGMFSWFLPRAFVFAFVAASASLCVYVSSCLLHLLSMFIRSLCFGPTQLPVRCPTSRPARCHYKYASFGELHMHSCRYMHPRETQSFNKSIKIKNYSPIKKKYNYNCIYNYINIDAIKMDVFYLK
jgi:hypothetical protein